MMIQMPDDRIKTLYRKFTAGDQDAKELLLRMGTITPINRHSFCMPQECFRCDVFEFGFFSAVRNLFKKWSEK